MFNAELILKAFHDLIGWRFDTTLDIELDPDLYKTTSNKYFQQAHPLLTLANLKAIAPDFDNISVPAWSSLVDYKAGVQSLVMYDDITYIALQDNIDVEPDSDNTIWSKFDRLSNWLRAKTNDSLLKAIGQIIESNILAGTGKSLVENKILFDGAGRLADVDPSGYGIVGFELIPARYRSLTLRIDKIGLQFTGPVDEPIVLYVFHSSSKQIYKTITLTRSQTNAMQWFSNEVLTLPYVGDSTDAGGSWYICYDKSLLPEGVRPIIKTKDWSSVTCSRCENPSAGYKLLSKYVEVYPFKYIGTFLDEGFELQDVAQNTFTHSNHGLNLELSVLCDYTSFFITQKNQLSNIILLQTGVDLLKEMTYNPNVRLNRNSLLAQRPELIYALDGDTSSYRKSGLKYELALAYKALSLDLQGIDRVCLPCKSKGIKYRVT